MTHGDEARSSTISTWLARFFPYTIRKIWWWNKFSFHVQIFQLLSHSFCLPFYIFCYLKLRSLFLQIIFFPFLLLELNGSIYSKNSWYSLAYKIFPSRHEMNIYEWKRYLLTFAKNKSIYFILQLKFISNFKINLSLAWLIN